RSRLRDEARKKSVLNLFSYTCSFSVAAALGGASTTVSIDLSSRALERGRENFARNGIPPGREHRLLREEVRAWLVRARRRGEKYDLIVLDPPTFASTEGKNSFRSVKDYAEVARDALCLLAPSGALLA